MRSAKRKKPLLRSARFEYSEGVTVIFIVTITGRYGLVYRGDDKVFGPRAVCEFTEKKAAQLVKLYLRN